MSVKKKKSHIFSGQHWPFYYELLKDPVITKVGLFDDVSLIFFFIRLQRKCFITFPWKKYDLSILVKTVYNVKIKSYYHLFSFIVSHSMGSYLTSAIIQLRQRGYTLLTNFHIREEGPLQCTTKSLDLNHTRYRIEYINILFLGIFPNWKQDALEQKKIKVKFPFWMV